MFTAEFHSAWYRVTTLFDWGKKFGHQTISNEGRFAVCIILEIEFGPVRELAMFATKYISKILVHSVVSVTPKQRW